MITEINSEDRLVQETFADHLARLGWDSIYAFNEEVFGPEGTLGRMSEREVVLVRDLEAALHRLNPGAAPEVVGQAIEKLVRVDPARSLLQHNREFYDYVRNGVPVQSINEHGQLQHRRLRVLNFDGRDGNRFLVVRELKIQGVRVPHYNRRADLVCFVNGLPLVFMELKAVYRNVRLGFDENLTDYLDENSIGHAFHHNAFLVVSNGDEARYGSITSRWEHFAEWKRNDEKEKSRVGGEVLLDGMLAPERLLDLVENFLLFDESRAGGTRKIVARNHQVLGVNNAVASVQRQEQLKELYPVERRIIEYEVPLPERLRVADRARGAEPAEEEHELPLLRRAHPDLGRLGVFWHTQGSGKSYSMAFFAEKVRRKVPGSFTFVVMTDREDLDDQIFRTFVGCGVVDEKTPRASSGEVLRTLLGQNHRFVFSLIHKFNQPVREPYTQRDDVIVISDEAHRTQAGKLARNMRAALPNAAFIGFTGTPLFKQDELTRRIFGDYISCYDFQRSKEDRSTVGLVYENRGEKLGLERLDLNDRIAEAVARAELDADQKSLLEKLLGKDYEVITADDRLDKLADDFVEHCSIRWQSGKSMLVCIDKVTCARMLQRIQPRWKARAARLRARLDELERSHAPSGDAAEAAQKEIDALRGQVAWMDSTLIQIVISEAQKEVQDFQKWDFDIIPHRQLLKTGFETPDGRRVPVEDAFKDPNHPFRVAIVCAMWLTGFDVECLSTLYIDKPMRAHNLMQAIARANRVYPGKDCGVIVDYNGILRSLREALAQYALGDDDPSGAAGLVIPIEERVAALIEALEATENHLRGLGFAPERLQGATGFPRIEALRDATDAVYASDDAKRRFEILARQVFVRFKALLTEPSALAYAARHDDVEAIYKKIQSRRDTADVTDLLKALHRIVNEAIQAKEPGDDHAEGLTVDLSAIDLEKVRDEFARRAARKNTAVNDICEVLEAKLAKMLATNPLRMDFYKKYQAIIADYNREKDRATVEATFAQLVAFAASLDAEQRRAAAEGLSDDELALFDLLYAEKITKGQRESLKQASRSLLKSLVELLAPMPAWTQKEATQAEVKVFILDRTYEALPRPPFTEDETAAVADRIYNYVWQRSAAGQTFVAA